MSPPVVVSANANGSIPQAGSHHPELDGEMARAGIEPATPRFSGTRGSRLRRREIPANAGYRVTAAVARIPVDTGGYRRGLGLNAALRSKTLCVASAGVTGGSESARRVGRLRARGRTRTRSA